MNNVVRKGMMDKVFDRFIQFCYSKYGLFSLFLFIFLSHIGLLKAPIFADDYIQNAYFQTVDAPNTSALKDVGILGDMPTGEFEFVLKNQFNFFDPSVGNDKAMLEYGALPWWTKEGTLLHLFRPVSSFTHWLDYQLWPNNFEMMHLHSLIIFMLGLWILLYMLQDLGLSRSMSMFAILLFGLDIGIAQALGWIAGRNAFIAWAIAPLVILGYHRGTSGYKSTPDHKILADKRWYFFSLFSLFIALFSAEAAIAIAGYLGAYMFAMDRRRWKHRILSILPFAILCILWRLWYQAQGYGSLHIGQYIDPGRSIVDFISHGIFHYPILFWHLFAGTDGVEGMMGRDALKLFSAWTMFWIVVLMAVFLTMSRRQKTVKFLLLSVLFSLVPGLALSYSDPRVLLIPSIAGFALIAIFIREVFLHAKTLFRRVLIRWFARLILGYFLFSHIALSVLALISVNLTLALGQIPEENRHGLYADITNQGELNFNNQRVVLINAPDLFGNMYTPYYYAYKGIQLPLSIRSLSSAFNTISVTRLSESKILVEPHNGFIFHNNDPLEFESNSGSGALHFHVIHPFKKLIGFFHNGEHDMYVGQTFSFNELKIMVKSVDNGRPLSIEVDALNPDDLKWLSWNWKEKKFEKFELPDIGQTVSLKGYFESQNSALTID